MRISHVVSVAVLVALATTACSVLPAARQPRQAGKQEPSASPRAVPSNQHRSYHPPKKFGSEQGGNPMDNMPPHLGEGGLWPEAPGRSAAYGFSGSLGYGVLRPGFLVATDLHLATEKWSVSLDEHSEPVESLPAGGRTRNSPPVGVVSVSRDKKVVYAVDAGIKQGQGSQQDSLVARVIAVDAASGHVRWRSMLVMGAYARGSAFLGACEIDLTGDRVVVRVRRGMTATTTFVLGTADGKLAWQQEGLIGVSGKAAYAVLPSRVGDRRYGLRPLDPRTGANTGPDIQLPGEWSEIHFMGEVNGDLLFVTKSSSLLEPDKWNTFVLDGGPTVKERGASTCAASDRTPTLAFCHNLSEKDPGLQAIDWPSQKVLWQMPDGSRATPNSATVFEDMVYVTINKRSVVIDGKTGKDVADDTGAADALAITDEGAITLDPTRSKYDAALRFIPALG